jgi:outer membrane protein assembly factor BamA
MRFFIFIICLYFIKFNNTVFAQNTTALSISETAQPIFLTKTLTSAVQVDSIVVKGNKRTKTRIITRELTFSNGDTLPLSSLSSVLEQNRLRLMNTNLFLSAKINLKNWTEENHVVVHIELIENWYLFPIPIFELADRNFNVWWKEQGRDFRRTNYGMRFTFTNATGRRDPLTALVQMGYTPKYSLSYSQPYINKKQNLGISISYFNAVNREVGAYTTGDKIFFYRDSARNVQLRRVYASAQVNYTPGLFDFHTFSFGYVNNKVAPSVAELNPDYFLAGKIQQRYLWLSYNFLKDKRDIRPYPLNGYILNISVSKSGLRKKDDVNALDVSIKYGKYFSFTPRLSLEMLWKGKTAFIRNRLPYTNARGLGFGSDFIRGYEYYVMEGFDYTYLKNSFRFSLLNKDIPIKPLSKIKLLKNWSPLPLKLYLTANFDAGYVNNPFQQAVNSLANRPLYGGGVGLDILAYYNMMWRLEYSANHLGEKGLYFSYSFAF